ncbi:MAG: Uma2 family endonuclease [Bacteroidota bacterium]
MVVWLLFFFEKICFEQILVEEYKVINSEVKVHIKTKNCYLYPDTMVVCGEIEIAADEPNAITNPKVIVEVRSKSTADYDRGDKFYLYRQLTSLEEYILIDQEKAQIDIHKRQGDLWKLSRISGLENTLTIKILDVSIMLAEIYSGVVVE